jgi:hypothetical protein
MNRDQSSLVQSVPCFASASATESIPAGQMASRGRVVPKCPAGHPAFNAHSRHETDQMLSGYHIEMCAAPKSHPEDGDATFARRATGDQRCRRTTILLRQAKLVTPHHRVRPLMRGAS